MSQSVYECLFLYDPNAYAKDPAGVAQTLTDLIESTGGEILVSRLWVEQKLAYPINGVRKGVYWLAYFKMEGTSLTKFERQCRLNDKLMRHLTLKVDPRLVDTLVAAAEGRALPGTEEETAEGEATQATDDNAQSAAPAETVSS